LKKRNYETKNKVELVEDPQTGYPKFVEAERDEVMLLKKIFPLQLSKNFHFLVRRGTNSEKEREIG